jgi:hypothetical protein
MGRREGLTWRWLGTILRAARVHGHARRAHMVARYSGMGFHITGDAKSDAVLDRYPFAILAGMMLDQNMS